jgi:hypothetical protein
MTDNDKNYDVGYGKPPKHTRYQAGRSGNPRGRPKGSAGFEILLAKHLGKTVNVTVDGQSRRTPVREAVVLSLIKSLLNGTPDQKIKLLRFIAPLLEQEEEPADEFDYDKLSDEELDLLERLLIKATRPQ